MTHITANRSRHYRILFTGLLIFVFTLPLSKSVSSIAAGLIYAYALAIATYDRSFRAAVGQHIRQPLTTPMLLFIFVLLGRSLFSHHVLQGLDVVKEVLNLPVVFLMTAVLIDMEVDEHKRLKNAESLMLVFLGGIFVLDVLGFLTYLGLIGDRRYVLPLTPLKMHHIWFGNLNAVGLYLASCLLLFFRGKKNAHRSMFLILFILAGVGSVLLSTSRTAWLGILVTAIVCAYFLIRNKRIYLVAVVFLIAGCLLLYSFSTIVHTRVDLIFEEVSLFSSGITSTSVGLRLLMWKAAATMFLSNPLFGVGTGDYHTSLSVLVSSGRFPDMVLRYNQPHNMYLFALATTGLMGLIALLFMLYKALRRAGRLLRGGEPLLGFPALALSVHFLTAGMTESLLNIHVLICSFALVAGICLRQSGIIRANPE